MRRELPSFIGSTPSGWRLMKRLSRPSHAVLAVGSTDVNWADWKVIQVMLEREIAKVKTAKAEHSGEKQGLMRRLRFY
jgi:hypothetical protein